MKTHYGDVNGSRLRGGSACGRTVSRSFLSTNRQHVTCQKCRGTSAFRRSLYAVATAMPEPGVAQTVTFGSPLNAQAIVTEIFQSLNKWAEDMGHCSDYDDALDTAQIAASKYGITIPKRDVYWDIETQERPRAGTEAEALAMIVAEPERYLTLREY